MAGELGFFGADTFGRGFWGWSSVALPIAGSVASAQLIADLSQERPNSQLIGATVEIEGEDFSTLIESIIIRTADSASTGSAELVVIGDVSAEVEIGDEVSISFSYTFATGSTYTKKVFDGIVKTIVPTTGSQTESTQISIWDEAEALLSQAPHNTTWTGTAKALVEDELTALGIEAYSADFDDYSMTAVDLTQFSTARDLIMAVANGQDECGIFTQSSGRVCVWSFESQREVVETRTRLVDELKTHLEQPPTNTSWNGSAAELVEAEGLIEGYSLLLYFDDFTYANADLTTFSSREELLIDINDSAPSGDGIWFYQDPEWGEYWWYEAEYLDYYSEEVDYQVTVGVYQFPRTGITYLQQIDVSHYRYKNYVVTGLTGTTATGTGTGTFDSGESSLFLTSEADLQPRADAVVDKRERNQIVFQSSLHPLVRVGDLVDVEQSAGVWMQGRVIGVTHQVEWTGQSSPGCWTTITAEVV